MDIGGSWQEIAVTALAAGAVAWLVTLRRRRAHRSCDSCTLAAAARDAPQGGVSDPPRNTPAAR